MAKKTSSRHKETGQSTTDNETATPSENQPDPRRACDNPESGRRRRKAGNINFSALLAKRKKVSADDTEVLAKAQEASNNGFFSVHPFHCPNNI